MLQRYHDTNFSLRFLVLVITKSFSTYDSLTNDCLIELDYVKISKTML